MLHIFEVGKGHITPPTIQVQWSWSWATKKPKDIKRVGALRSFQPLFCTCYLSRQLLDYRYSSFASSFKLGTAKTAGLKCDTTHHNLMRPLGLRATQPHSPCTYKHTHTVNQNQEHLAKYPRALFKGKKLICQRHYNSLEGTRQSFLNICVRGDLEILVRSGKWNHSGF